MTELVLVAESGDGTVSALNLQTDGTAHLNRLATSPVGDGCGTFAVDARRDLVYAAAKGEPAQLVTLRLDRASGELTETSRRAVDDSLTYLELTHDGSVLLGASFGGGFAASWQVGDDGTVGEPRSRVEFANAHCVVAAGPYAYVVSLGEDLVAQFSVAPGGALTPLDPPTVACPEGSGPRHLVLAGSNAYLVTEYSAEAIRFDVADDGTLTAAESVRIDDPAANLAHSRMGADPLEEHLRWGADLHVARGFLLCSERTASTIASVALDADGRLGQVVSISGTETQPRGFVVTPDERLAIAAGERSTHLRLHRVEDDGRLVPVERVAIGAKANWVRVV
ncbi:lactonase family protein [Agilicoccus flavus]|uniref:lactonase family protein n=1 Tax=Agilicoccus flavus TaxID=2775968 RepID=UPI001CF60CA0|nr:beta-propeller fold lactonase family protein [Agilicoccus flavus]